LFHNSRKLLVSKSDDDNDDENAENAENGERRLNKQYCSRLWRFRSSARLQILVVGNCEARDGYRNIMS
jgi:hypothetical protein